jgi:serine/threonine protein kinase
MPEQMQAWASALSGQQVGDYTLGECIGHGGFGLVFEVSSNATGTKYAMKVLVPSNDPGITAEFEREGILLKHLVKCSSVINLVESGTDTFMMCLDASPVAVVPVQISFHVLALASGDVSELTMDPDLLKRLDWSERLTILRGAVKGVHQMHLKSVAHRDLKSANCLLVVQGARSEVRVADLGRAKDVTLAPTLAPFDYLRGRGDFRFAAPEYLWMQGASDAASLRSADLYGLGSLFAELATGHPITALAIGSWQTAMVDAQRDISSGIHRDLAILRPQFRRAIEEIADELPRTIRHGAVELLSQLCDPVPTERHHRTKLGRTVANRPGLEWLIRRVDILSKQLQVQTSIRIRYKKNRSA